MPILCKIISMKGQCIYMFNSIVHLNYVFSLNSKTFYSRESFDWDDKKKH